MPDGSPSDEFRILGGLRLLRNGVELDLGPVKQRICFAVLLCRANRLTTIELLTEAIWDGIPPPSARKNVQVYIAGLRRVVGTAHGERITFRTGGYVLRVTRGEADHLQFDGLLGEARTALRERAYATAARLLGSAIDLWHGPALEALQTRPVLDAESARLTARYGLALESWAEAELELGNPEVVLDRLTAEVARYPLRERMVDLLMTAAARCGRTGEAIAAYTDLRRHLAEELGVRPAATVEATYRTVLSGRWPTSTVGRAARGGGPALLPADPAGFSGRSGETARVTDALFSGGSRVAVLSGPVGIGKTAVAVRVAHRLLPAFTDGAVFVPVRRPDGTARDLAVVAAGLLRATGHPHAEPDPDAPERWQAWASTRRLLVVLDDVADPATLHALMTPAGPAAFLVTARSRVLLPGADLREDLSVLPEEDAVAMLRLLTRRTDLDDDEAGRIVRAVGCFPLAVHRAGLKLAASRHVSVVALRERLEGRVDGVLDALDTAGGELRTHLRAALADLSPAERTALADLADLADLAPSRVEALVEKGFVDRTEPEVVAHGDRSGACFALPFPLAALLRSRTPPDRG